MAIEFYYHNQSPPAQMAWMTLEALKLDYKELEMDLWSTDGGEDRARLHKVNPYVKVPALRDGDLCIGESRAIAIYLCSKYEDPGKKNKLYPTDVDAAAKVNMELFADMDAIKSTQQYMNLDAVFTDKGVGPLPEKFNEVKTYLDQSEKMLEHNDFLVANHMTIADFSRLNIAGLLDMADFQGWKDYPNIVAWRKRMSDLPYYEKCHAQGLTKNREMYKKQNEKNQNA